MSEALKALAEIEAALAPFVRDEDNFMGQPDENRYKMVSKIGDLRRVNALVGGQK